MDGFEALRRLREHPDTRNIPVIAITAYAMAGDIQRGKTASFDEYLTKPLDVVQLLITLDRFLAGDAQART